jgi:hypothetical protein
MLIEGAFPVAAQPQALLSHLFDARLVASCLPGCEALERIDDDRYRAVVVVAMAGIKARFDLQVEITKREERDVWAVTRGEEGGRASTLQADSRVSLEPTADGTVVNYRSEVSVSGRLGRFALGMMKKKAQSMGDEFAANLRQKLEAVGAAGDMPAATAASEPGRRNDEPKVAEPGRGNDEPQAAEHARESAEPAAATGPECAEPESAPGRESAQPAAGARERAMGDAAAPLGEPPATNPAAAGEVRAGAFQPAADRPVAADGSSAPAPVDGDAPAGARSASSAATPSWPASPAASPAQH